MTPHVLVSSVDSEFGDSESGKYLVFDVIDRNCTGGSLFCELFRVPPATCSAALAVWKDKLHWFPLKDSLLQLDLVL